MVRISRNGPKRGATCVPSAAIERLVGPVCQSAWESRLHAGDHDTSSRWACVSPENSAKNVFSNFFVSCVSLDSLHRLILYRHSEERWLMTAHLPSEQPEFADYDSVPFDAVRRQIEKMEGRTPDGGIRGGGDDRTTSRIAKRSTWFVIVASIRGCDPSQMSSSPPYSREERQSDHAPGSFIPCNCLNGVCL